MNNFSIDFYISLGLSVLTGIIILFSFVKSTKLIYSIYLVMILLSFISLSYIAVVYDYQHVFSKYILLVYWFMFNYFSFTLLTTKYKKKINWGIYSIISVIIVSIYIFLLYAIKLYL